MAIINVPESNQAVIDNIFSTDKEIGLYFKQTWDSDLAFSNVQVSDYLKCFYANSIGLKKVQLFKNGETIDWDGFEPKSNLEYMVLSKGEGVIEYHHHEPVVAYDACKELAKKLMNAGKEVLIAEQHTKVKTISSNYSEPTHPFSLNRVEGNVFFNHTRTGIFSNLITEQEQKSFDLNDLNGWMSAGHSNLILAKRVAIFNNNEVINFGKVDKNAKHDVFTRKEFISSFGSYSEALNFCKAEHKRHKYGCEFLICESIHYMTWH